MRGKDIQIGDKYVTVFGDVVEVTGQPFKGSAWWWPVNYLTGRHYGGGEPTLRSAHFDKKSEEAA